MSNIGHQKANDLWDQIDRAMIDGEGRMTAFRALEKVCADSLNEYQLACMRTHVDAPERLACYGLGIAGEAGEVADLIKKHIGHGHPLDRAKLCLELGDVLWYVAAIAAMNGIDLSQVAAENIRKLQKRYPDGFSSEASIARADLDPRAEVP